MIEPYYKTDNCELYHCDNLDLLKQLPDNYIDLIYCDILYGTGKNFGDYSDLKPDRKIIEDHYIPRITEMKRVLKNSGNIYIHSDYHINHWIRCILDNVFGYGNFRNEIIWHYRTYQGRIEHCFPRKHDTILFYGKSKESYFKLIKDNNFDQTIDFTRWRKYLNENNQITGNNYPQTDSRFSGYIRKFIKQHHRRPGNQDVILQIYGSTIDSVWDIKAIDPKNIKEKLNYITQKPSDLLSRIILSSSDIGFIVADFYMGSGTTGEVALELGRKFIGCDIGDKACEVTKKRIEGI